jgi:anaerobic selenocysteine-containing dehydrogenase
MLNIVEGSMTDVTRREFIRLATLMGGACLFAGCTLLEDSAAVPEYIKGAPGVDPLETLNGIKNVYTVCALCPGNCGISCRVAQGTLVKIGGSPYHPVTADTPLPFDTPLETAITYGGSVCAVGGSGIQTLYDPFRVARPLKRVGPRGSGKWKALTWNDAVKEIVEGGNLFDEGNITGLRAIEKAGTGLSFMVGRADWGALTFIRRFLAEYSGSVLVRDKAAMMDELAAEAADSVFGPGTGPVDADYGHARFLLSFGDAPLDSGVPLVSVARQIADARTKGPCLRWAVVDPRLSTSASKADLWIPVIPGTDLNLALGIMSALLEHYPSAIKIPLEGLRRLVSGRTSADYAHMCGVSPEIPVKLAGYFAQEREASAAVPGRGIFSQADGIDVAKVILTLNLMVGSVPGSGGLAKRNDDFLRQADRNLVPDMKPGPKSTIPDANSKALILWEADPVYDDPQIASEQFKDREKIPLLVVIDRELTETSALADYILPDTTYLERWDICISPPSVTTPGFGVRVPVVGGLDEKTGDFFPILPETKPMEDILILLAGNVGLRGFKPEEPGGIRNARNYYQQAIDAAIDSIIKEGFICESVMCDASKVMDRGGLFAVPGISPTIKIEPGKSVHNVLPNLKSIDEVPGMNDELLLISYTLPFHRSSRSVVNSWLMEILPYNRLIISVGDASRFGMNQGEKIFLETTEGKVRTECRAHVVPGIRPGVVALARGYGNSQSGAARTLIDGSAVTPDKTRGTGINTFRLVLGPGPTKVKVKKT